MKTIRKPDEDELPKIVKLNVHDNYFNVKRHYDNMTGRRQHENETKTRRVDIEMMIKS